jgi:hypothetical protein
MMKATNEMTRTELKEAAREYDDICNEGGEGYNPYRDEMAKRDRVASPKTKYDELETLKKDRRFLTSSVAKESGLDDDAKVTAIEQKITALEAEINAEYDAKFCAEWTLEVTIARRAAWNAEAVKPGANTIKIIKAVGFNRTDLVDAIKHYGL